MGSINGDTMRVIKKFFKTLVAIIIIPTLIIIGVILWSYMTGDTLKLSSLPFVNSADSEDNFLLNASIQTAEVYETGSETPLGVRGYIKVSRAELAAMTPSQYFSFYETVLKGSDYLWFSVICPDGTGLFIPDCADGAACFCSLNDLGRQTEVYGYMLVRDGTCIYQEAEASR